ncbi:MAG: hypothetical protein WCL23_01425 [Candidatus Moraniibacteriota bacterium]
MEDERFDDNFLNEKFVSHLEEFCSDELRRQLRGENHIALVDEFFKRWSEVPVGVLRNDFPETWMRERDLRNESCVVVVSVGPISVSVASYVDLNSSDALDHIILNLN